MEKQKVRFYFAYNSPYAFLASTRIEKEVSPYPVEIEYRPVYSPRKGGGGPDLAPAKMQYIIEDIQRFAQAYGIALNMGPFSDTKKACTGFLFAQEKGRGKAYLDAVYRARWCEGKDIGEEETLAAVAEECGLNREEFLAALTAPRYGEALDQSNKEAETDGVFGVPFLVYQDQKFWGNDRIEWLLKAIGSDKT